MSKARRSHFDTDTAAAVLLGWGCFPTRDLRLEAAFAVSNHPERFSAEVKREALALLIRSSQHGTREARQRVEHNLARTEREGRVAAA